MSFGESFLLNASKFNDIKSIATDLEYVRGLVVLASEMIASRHQGAQGGVEAQFAGNPATKSAGKNAGVGRSSGTKTAAAAAPFKFQAKDVLTYVHGSYSSGTNIYFPTTLEICVELKMPDYPFEVLRNYYISPFLTYGPEQFRQELFEALSEIMARRFHLECAFENHVISMPQHGVLKHPIAILPAVTFNFHENEGAAAKGLLVFDPNSGKCIATFPHEHEFNGAQKDKRTKGNFKAQVRLWKTLRLIAIREPELTNDPEAVAARGYFIECLLYNVPDFLFSGDNLGFIFLKVLNYLSHANISTFVCQNRIWHLFNQGGEFWSAAEARRFVAAIAEVYANFDYNRSKLA